MKCIKKHGKIKRVSNSDAVKFVNEKEWEYCSKKEWKKQRNENEKS